MWSCVLPLFSDQIANGTTLKLSPTASCYLPSVSIDLTYLFVFSAVNTDGCLHNHAKRTLFFHEAVRLKHKCLCCQHHWAHVTKGCSVTSLGTACGVWGAPGTLKGLRWEARGPSYSTLHFGAGAARGLGRKLPAPCFVRGCPQLHMWAAGGHGDEAPGSCWGAFGSGSCSLLSPLASSSDAIKWLEISAN